MLRTSELREERDFEAGPPASSMSTSISTLMDFCPDFVCGRDKNWRQHASVRRTTTIRLAIYWGIRWASLTQRRKWTLTDLSQMYAEVSKTRIRLFVKRDFKPEDGKKCTDSGGLTLRLRQITSLPPSYRKRAKKLKSPAKPLDLLTLGVFLFVHPQYFFRG